MKIILINGKYRSGKDYFARILKQELNKKIDVMSFADALKDIVAKTFDISREDLDLYKNDQSIIGVNYKGSDILLTDMRSVLQKFGTEAMQFWFGKFVWVDLLQKNILKAAKKGTEIVLVPDFRFKHEYLQDSITINIFNKNLINNDQHLSETSLIDFNFDFYIDNTNHPDLRLQVLNFIEMFNLNEI